MTVSLPGIRLFQGTLLPVFDKELNKELTTPNAEWELGEFIYEIIDSRHPMEQYRAPQFLRRRPERIRFERYEKGAIWDTYRFRGETVAGREPNNLMVEFRVFNVTKNVDKFAQLPLGIRGSQLLVQFLVEQFTDGSLASIEVDGIPGTSA